MKMGGAEGLGKVYDEEGKLIFDPGERMYGRRGFALAIDRGGGLVRKSMMEQAQWLIYYTNQRIVGLRDMSAQEASGYLATLRPFERSRFEGEGAEQLRVMRFFEVPLKEVVRAQRRRRDTKIVVQPQEPLTLTFEPGGPAARFFSRLLHDYGEEA